MYPLNNERTFHIGGQLDADVKAKNLTWG